MLAHHELLCADDGQAERDGRVLGQVGHLAERELGREPHALDPPVGHCFEREAVHKRQVRARLHDCTQLGGALHRAQALGEHGLSGLHVAPGVEAEQVLAGAGHRVVVDHGQRRDALLRVAGLLCRARALTGDYRLAALVVESWNVDRIGAGALGGARAGRVRHPCGNGAAPALGRDPVGPLLHARKDAVAIGSQQARAQVVERFGAHAVQLGEADAHVLVEFDVERVELERRLPEPVDMRPDVRRGNSLRARRLHDVALRHAGGVCSITRRAGKPELDAQRLANAQPRRTDHAHARRQRVVGEAGGDVAHAEHAVALAHRPLRGRAHVARLVGLEGTERVGEVTLVRPKLQHIAFMQLFFGGDGRHPVARVGHAAHENTAVVGAPVAHDVVAALAREVRGGEAARECLLERAALVAGSAHGGILPYRARRARGQHAVEHYPVGGRHRVHVVGGLHAPLYLERGGAGRHQLGHEVDGAEILRREQVLARRRQLLALRAVAQLVGKPARLGTQAPVRRAAADHRGHEALARIAHAQGAVGERLHLQAEVGRNMRQMLYFRKGQLARERHAARAQLGGRLDAGSVVGVHLRGDMQARLGKRPGELGGHAHVLHDEGIGAGAVRLPCAFERTIDLRGQDGGVKRHVHAHAAQMRVVAGLAEGLEREVVGVAPRVERVQSQVDGVRPTRHRRMQRLCAPRRGEQLHSRQPGALFVRHSCFLTAYLMRPHGHYACEQPLHALLCALPAL